MPSGLHAMNCVYLFGFGLGECHEENSKDLYYIHNH